MTRTERYDWHNPTPYMRRHRSLDNGKCAPVADSRAPNPTAGAEANELRELLTAAIDSWPSRDPRDRSQETARLVLKGYRPKEIADTMKVSSSRASQLVRDVLRRFRDMKDDFKSIKRAVIYDTLARIAGE